MLRLTRWFSNVVGVKDVSGNRPHRGSWLRPGQASTATAVTTR